MSNIANKLTDNIKQQLSLRSMSVSELERRAGLKQSTLQNILYGRSKNPSIETIKSIAKELNCSIEELIGDLSSFTSMSKVVTTEQPSAVSSGTLARTTEAEPDFCPWSASLYIKAIEVVQGILDQKKLSLPKKQVLASVDEVYKYSIGISDEIDRRFAEWIIEKIR